MLPFHPKLVTALVVYFAQQKIQLNLTVIRLNE